MRWLQWSSVDLAHGLGGVEVHARSLARELRNLGVAAALSSDPATLEDSRWDVVQTHGSACLPPRHLLGARRGTRSSRAPLRVHTLHGTSLDRLAACHEWTWLGGYAAYAREWAGTLAADVVLGVHPEIAPLRLAGRLGKVTAVCSNGWDAALAPAELPEQLEAQLRDQGAFWLYLGRGGDPTKGARYLRAALSLLPDLRLVAAPGEGFESEPRVLQTGRLDSAAVYALLLRARGLILPSVYEALPLVVLEALGLGVPVVATLVGGVRTLPAGLAGLVTVPSRSPRALAEGVHAAIQHSIMDRDARAATNRLLLPTWADVAARYLAAVEQAGRARAPLPPGDSVGS